jgi:hypothetical protein
MTTSSATPAPPRRHWLRTAMVIVAGLLVVIFIGLQLIPVNRTNPPVTTQLKWDSPQTKALARRACMDCHSNETVWPWYSYVAPASWLIYYDVQKGRDALNFSTYGASQDGRSSTPSASGELAYQLGQMMVGGNKRPGGGGPGEGHGGFPPPGGEPPQGQFPPGGGRGRTGEISEHIQSGQMPPAQYLLIHSDAKLTAEEKQQLIQGLEATLKATTP